MYRYSLVLLLTACSLRTVKFFADSGSGGTDSGVSADSDSDSGVSGGDTATDASGHWVEVESDCEVGEPGYNEWQESGPTDSAVRIIGVNQATTDGELRVVVEDPLPITLILAAETATHWTVEETTPGTIQHIVVTGYEAGSIDAPSTAVVEQFYTDGNRWPRGYQWYDSATQALVDQTESYLAAPVTSFHGCYDASTFTIKTADVPVDTSDRPACDEPSTWTPWEDPDTSYVASLCPDVTAESAWCLAQWQGTIQAVGLDSGNTCTVLDSSDPDFEDYDEMGLAMSGDSLYTCNYDTEGGLLKISLEDGHVEQARTWCGAPAWASSEGGLLMSKPETDGEYSSFGNEVQLATSWDQAWCSEDDASGITSGDNLIGVIDDTVYTATYTGGSLHEFALADGADLGRVALDYDGWINGIASLPHAGQVVLSTKAGLVRVDPSTGAVLDTITTLDGEYLDGAVCFEND